MTTYEVPESLSARLPQRSVVRFRSYVPSAPIPPEVWERVRLDLIGIVADTAPPSDTDARTVLSALCGFYSWASVQFRQEDIRCLLTAERLLAYETATSAQGTNGTRQNIRARLNRCRRVIHGEPATTRRSQRDPSAEPCLLPALQELVVAALASEPLARVLAVALTSGKSGQQGVGRAMPTAAAIDSALRRLGVVQAGELCLAAESAKPLSDEEWRLGREAARRAGLDIATDRLRLTWALAAMKEPGPVADLIASHGVSRRDLDNVVRHLPASDDDSVMVLLRGA